MIKIIFRDPILCSSGHVLVGSDSSHWSQSPHEYLLDLKERAQNSKIIVNLFDVWLKIGITV